MRSRARFIIIFVSLVVFGVTRVVCDLDGLRKNFYKNSCPQAEKRVREIVWSKAQNNPSLGAKLLRMHYHDCFVRVCVHHPHAFMQTCAHHICRILHAYYIPMRDIKNHAIFSFFDEISPLASIYLTFWG